MSKNFMNFLRITFVGATITSIVILTLHAENLKSQVEALSHEQVDFKTEVKEVIASTDSFIISLKTVKLQLDAKNKCDYHAKVLTAKTQSACIDAMIVLGDFSKEYLK